MATYLSEPFRVIPDATPEELAAIAAALGTWLTTETTALPLEAESLWSRAAKLESRGLPVHSRGVRVGWKV